MQSEHTPGPWHLITADGADFTAIATRPIPAGAMDLDAEVLGTSEWLRVEEADLRVMAASPELLDLAKALLRASEEGLIANTADEDTVGVLHDFAVAAITRATAVTANA